MSGYEAFIATHVATVEADEKDDAALAPVGYKSWLLAVAAGRKTRNVLLGPSWAFERHLDQYEKAMCTVEHIIHPERKLRHKHSWRRVFDDCEMDALMLEPLFDELMRKELGTPLCEQLTEAELDDRAELYAERSSHGRWNSGYETERFRGHFYGHGPAYWRDSYMNYMRFSSYKPFTGLRAEQAETDAAVTQMQLHRAEAPLAQTHTSFIQDTLRRLSEIKQRVFFTKLRPSAREYFANHMRKQISVVHGASNAAEVRRRSSVASVRAVLSVIDPLTESYQLQRALHQAHFTQRVLGKRSCTLPNDVARLVESFAHNRTVAPGPAEDCALQVEVGMEDNVEHATKKQRLSIDLRQKGDASQTTDICSDHRAVPS